MKFNEIEKLVNKKIEEENLAEGKFSYNDCAYEVKKIVNEVIGNNERIILDCGYGDKGNVVLKVRGEYNYQIVFKVRRKKNGFEYTGIWGSINYYGIKKIEIENMYDVESLEDFIKYVDDCRKSKEEYRAKKIVEFEEMLESEGISFERFYEMMNKYKNLDYSDKTNIAKEYCGEENYWRYV